MRSADHVIVEHIAGVEDYQVAFVTERSFCEPPGADVREVELTIDFRESCHKQGIHLSFQAPMCAGALRTKD